jgi:hypothetical protein
MLRSCYVVRRPATGLLLLLCLLLLCCCSQGRIAADAAMQALIATLEYVAQLMDYQTSRIGLH